MTERKGHYFEVCIALDSSEFSEIFTSEIMDFCGEAVEIADNKIIVRTSKDRDFIDALLAHLSDFGAKLNENIEAIWQKNVSFTHTIEKKQNRDWIEEYKSGIKPIRCGKFYICPPWDNLSLGVQFRTCENFGDFADTKSSLNPQNFHKYKSHTANTSIVCNTESAKDSSLRGESIDSPKQSIPNRHTERSEVSKTRESSKKAESMTDKRINELDLPLQHSDSYNLDSQDLDSSLVSLAQNDKIREYSQNLGAHKSELQTAESTIDIILEPSLAFGTGHHSSTFMCIQAIESLGENGVLKNKTLLDFGCGSGILALCANKLGAKVDLCDIDELAIDESKKNFYRNNATISHIWQGGIKRESKGDIAQKSAKYDIITANIIASILIEQKENIDFVLKRGGIAILSGILDIYKDEVLARFSDFEVLNIAQKDEWICIMLRKF